METTTIEPKGLRKAIAAAMCVECYSNAFRRSTRRGISLSLWLHGVAPYVHLTGYMTCLNRCSYSGDPRYGPRLYHTAGNPHTWSTIVPKSFQHRLSCCAWRCYTLIYVLWVCASLLRSILGRFLIDFGLIFDRSMSKPNSNRCIIQSTHRPIHQYPRARWRVCR